MPFEKNKKRNIVMLGIILIGLFLSYGHFLKTAKLLHYKIFDLKDNYSWYQSRDGLYRLDAKGDLDAITLSQDKLRDFEFSFSLINPRTSVVLFNYQDKGNYHFVYFDTEGGKAVLGLLKDGKTTAITRVNVSYPQIAPIKIDLKDKIFKLFVNQKNAVSLDLGSSSEEIKGGFIGLMLTHAGLPKTVFHGISLKGHNVKGEWIRAPEENNTSLKIKQQMSVGLLFVFMLSLGIYLCVFLQKYAAKFSLGLEKNGEERINPRVVFGVHFLITVFLFWPFLARKEILVSSADNLGEIYPLFIYSKQVFWNIFHGHSLGLWNPFAHNGIPFFSNHWNMIYYPLNWIIFLFSDQDLLTALTAKAFLEVLALGLCAYGFFSLELPSKKWALFSSIVYQMCSLLIFTFSIFPSTSFFFAGTLYLYCLWSIPKRRDAWNYILLALSVVLALTSANTAFIFYGGLALATFTLYRVLSLKGKERGQTIRIAFLSLLTGLLISAVRIIPCVIGVMDSNRVVENFYTLHDRFFLFIRLFLPEIVGWLGAKSFNALTSPNLNLIFEQSDLPSNSQNTFFVYFGVLSALLLAVNIFIGPKGKHAFWKAYAFVALALGLMFQPFWGIFNILLFPFNHYSYYIIILPVGICALLGFTGHYLETENVKIPDLLPKLSLAILFVQIYIFIFLTYLFPSIASFSRVGILILIGMGIAFSKVRDKDAHLLRISGVLLGLCWIGLFAAAAAAISSPIEAKEEALRFILLPILGLLSAAALEKWLYASGFKIESLKNKNALAAIGLGIVVACAPSMGAFFSEMDVGLRSYLLDVSFGEIKFILLIVSGLSLLILYKNTLISKDYLWFAFVVLTLLDLIGFNARFDNVSAPTPYKQAFLETVSPYKDISPEVKGRLDLINYRAHKLQQAGLNANENLIFGIPSYSGIMGHMPKRFSKFIINFGYPKRTVLIYPEEASSDERFLDLSAVKYEFLNEQNVSERPNALSRMMMFYDYSVAGNEGEMLKRIKEDGFHPKEQVFINKDPQIAKVSKPAESVNIVGGSVLSSDQILSEINSKEDGVLLFNESYDKNWKAFVDNQEVPVFIANYAFMACPVKAGRHVVEFRFQPKLFYRSLQISFWGLILFFITLVYLFRTDKRIKL